MSGYCFDCGHTICVCADDIPARDPITRACDPLGSDAIKISDARTLDSGGQRMVGTSPPDSRAGTSATEELSSLRSLLQTTEAARDTALKALVPFAPGSHDGLWGRIKAFVVQGAPTREEGIKIARQITEWQVAIPASAYADSEV